MHHYQLHKESTRWTHLIHVVSGRKLTTILKQHVEAGLPDSIRRRKRHWLWLNIFDDENR
jgi:hypothetical protein